MQTVNTYRKHTAAAIVAAAAANPAWTIGGNLIAALPNGDICFAVVHPREDNGYAQQLVLLNCLSVHHPKVGFGAGVRLMDIDDDDLDALEQLEAQMWDDINSNPAPAGHYFGAHPESLTP